MHAIKKSIGIRYFVHEASVSAYSEHNSYNVGLEEEIESLLVLLRHASAFCL